MAMVLETEGEFKGWRRLDNQDTFDAMAGPFWFREDPDGRTRGAFRAERKHMNIGHRAHGGLLMTFADIALFQIAYRELEGSSGWTVQLETSFIDGAGVGDLVESTGEVVRAGNSLVFVRGQLTTGERTLLTFSGIIRKFGKRPVA